MKKNSFCYIWLIFLLAACRSANISPTLIPSNEPARYATAEATSSMESDAIQLTPTPLGISEATGQTPSPEYVEQNFPTVANTPSPTQDWSPFYPPTKTADELSETIQTVTELYEQNKGCQLPCWWGITPGKTNLSEALNFLFPLAERVALNGHIMARLGAKALVVDIWSPREMFPMKWDGPHNTQWYVYDEAEVVQIVRISAGQFENYDIPHLLRQFGEPEAIWAWGGVGFSATYIVSLYLYYPDYGIFSTQTTTVDWEDTLDGTALACYQFSSELFLWSPQNPLNYEDIASYGLTDIASYTFDLFRTIDEVTNYDKATFTNTFSKLNSPVCLDIDTSTWFEMRSTP